MDFKPFEQLELKDSFMFNAVMSNPELCKECLERIMDIKISKIEYPQHEVTMDPSIYAKGIRLDVYTEGDGVIYDIEMQTTQKIDIPKRSRYYQGVIDLNNLEKGQNYTSLKQSVVIFIGFSDPFGSNRHKYTFENRCVEEPSIALNDGTKKIFLNTMSNSTDINYELETFLNYIATGMVTDKFTDQLDREVKSVRLNEKWRGDYMTLMTRISEEREEAKAEGREEGRAEGRAEGREEGITGVAVEMIKAGLDNDTVIKFTHFSSDQVNQLRLEIGMPANIRL